MQTRNKVTIAIVFTFISTVDGVINFINKIISKDNYTNMNWSILIQILSMIIIFSGCFYILGQIDKLKTKYELGLLLCQVRDVITYHEIHGNEVPLKLPNESDEIYFKRTNASKYQERLKNESEQLATFAYKKLSSTLENNLF